MIDSTIPPHTWLFFFLTRYKGLRWDWKEYYMFGVITKKGYFHLQQFLANHSVPCHRKAWIISLKKALKPRISILSGWTAIAHRLASRFCSSVFIMSVERLPPPFKAKSETYTRKWIFSKKISLWCPLSTFFLKF